MKNTMTKTLAVVCSATLLATLVGCGDVVVKVQKKNKNVDLSAVENFDALNLTNSDDFLKQLDGLKVVAADVLLKEMSQRNYRSQIRSQIRSYRTYLIEHATKPVNMDDSFYTDTSKECREAGLDFNMDKSNNILGIILKTAVLAKLSEVSAGALNPGLGKELAAIGQLIVKELGIKIEGGADVEKDDDLTKTTGNFTLQLLPISGEEIDDATKKRDADEVMSMSFSRNLGENYVGDFAATIGISHEVSEGVKEDLEGALAVERAEVDDRFVHTLDFKLGVKGKKATYSRKMVFEQVDGAKNQLKLSDTLNPDSKSASTVVTVIDVDAGTQCKLEVDIGKGDGDTGNADGKGDSDGGGTDGVTDGGDGKGDSDGGGTDGLTDGGKGDSGTDGDEPIPGGDDGDETPTQQPGQNPGQHK